MSTLLDFYRGRGTDHRGRTFDDLIALSDDEFERQHDFIQWLFPLPEPSLFNPDAPLLTEEDRLAFFPGGADADVLHANVMRAYQRFMDFLEETHQWLRHSDHNHLRITRAIKFLVMTGHESQAKTLLGYCVGNHPNLNERSRKIWVQAFAS